MREQVAGFSFGFAGCDAMAIVSSRRRSSSLGFVAGCEAMAIVNRRMNASWFGFAAGCAAMAIVNL